jgi:hypothetical protein
MDIMSIPKVAAFFRLVVNPAVDFLFAAAALYFVYGVWEYIRRSDDSAGRIEGGNHILWSTIGLFIMISVWGIIAILQKTVGVN